MRAYVVLSLLTVAVTTSVADEQEIDPRLTRSRTVVEGFASELKRELRVAIRTGGPEYAIDVCRVRAPEIARELSESTGATIGRTSLKTRNPRNTPTDWQRAVLEQFEQRVSAGEAAKSLEFAERVIRTEGEGFRYMKAIPTGSLCVTCHGTELAPQVANAIDEFYPDDRARGFEVGDLRGAFVVEWPAM